MAIDRPGADGGHAALADKGRARPASSDREAFCGLISPARSATNPDTTHARLPDSRTERREAGAVPLVGGGGGIEFREVNPWPLANSQPGVEAVRC